MLQREDGVFGVNQALLPAGAENLLGKLQFSLPVRVADSALHVAELWS